MTLIEPPEFTQPEGLNKYQEKLMFQLGDLQDAYHKIGKRLLELEREHGALEDQQYQLSQSIDRLTDYLYRGHPIREERNENG